MAGGRAAGAVDVAQDAGEDAVAMVPEYQTLRDYHCGSPVVVVGNGPSLAAVPDAFLLKWPLMVCNSFYLRKGIVANWYLLELTNHLKSEQRNERMPYARRVVNGGGYLLVNRRVIQYFQHLPNVFGVGFLEPPRRVLRAFQFDPFDVYGADHSVLYSMLQFAYYLTSGPVLMVGVDHKFEGERWHFYPDEDSPHYAILRHDQYEGWRKEADPYFVTAAEIYERSDRDLLNLTPDSAATMFATDGLENWA